MIRRGTNPRRWALANCLPPSSVYGALRGERAGVESVKITKQLDEFLYGQQDEQRSAC